MLYVLAVKTRLALLMPCPETASGVCAQTAGTGPEEKMWTYVERCTVTGSSHVFVEFLDFLFLVPTPSVF